MLDRTTPPAAQPIQFVPFPEPAVYTLSKEVQLYCIQHGNQPVIELQVVFQGGYCYEKTPGVSLFTPKMMNEGTKSYLSAELSELFDFYGVSLAIETAFETIRLSLSALEKQIAQVIPILQEILTSPTFPIDEYDLMLSRVRQAIQVDSRKTSYWARRLSGHLLWGKEHPYGRHIGIDELKQISLDQLIEYHREIFCAENLTLVAVGNFNTENLRQLCEELISKIPLNKSVTSSNGTLAPSPNAPGTTTYPVPDTMQSTIRIALPLFKRNHPDYHALRLVNTIFGGFFGSRLMKNIREEKGYTYGIGSSLMCYKYNGMWVIQTETAHEYVQDTLQEINYEVDKLHQELVTAEELEIASNYLLGRMLGSQETPFQISDMFLTQLVNGLPADDWESAYKTIQSVTPAQIRELSQQYLNPNEMRIVVCGKEL